MIRLIIFTILGLILVQNYTYSQEDKQNVICWLSSEYIECLKKRLPCECEKDVETYFSITVDTSLSADLHRITLLKYAQMEPYYYRLKKEGANRYSILRSKDIDCVLGTITFNKDTLLLYEKGISSKYLRTSFSNRLGDNSYGVDNVELINKAFVDRGYATLKETLSQDGLQCACNKWIGNLNLLSIKGKSDSWVLEQTTDSLFIYKVVNNEDADPDDSIVKEKIYEYKW